MGQLPLTLVRLVYHLAAALVLVHNCVAKAGYSYGNEPYHSNHPYHHNYRPNHHYHHTRPIGGGHHHHRGSSSNNNHNNNNPNSQWLPATATWYGSANGAGSDGGACGYGSVAHTAYGSNVGAGSPVLFRNGRGCGACYQVKCLVGGGLCSNNPVTIVIIDECPGGYCAFGRTHFDMSGTAFGHMASGSGTTPQLLNAGVVQVLYQRVPCSYRGTRLAFQVNEGATSYWFSMLVRYEDGDGDLSTVQLMQGDSSTWEQMEQLWGAYWCLNAGPLRAPFSIRLTSSSGSTLTAYDAIPANWSPGSIYTANVNFPS